MLIVFAVKFDLFISPAIPLGVESLLCNNILVIDFLYIFFQFKTIFFFQLDYIFKFQYLTLMPSHLVVEILYFNHKVSGGVFLSLVTGLIDFVGEGLDLFMQIVYLNVFLLYVLGQSIAIVWYPLELILFLFEFLHLVGAVSELCQLFVFEFEGVTQIGDLLGRKSQFFLQILHFVWTSLTALQIQQPSLKIFNPFLVVNVVFLIFALKSFGDLTLNWFKFLPLLLDFHLHLVDHTSQLLIFQVPLLKGSLILADGALIAALIFEILL